MMGSGGMIVMDEDDCMVSIAKFYLEFTLDESCGKCTPCRIGNKRLFEILEKITEGLGNEEDLTRLRSLCKVIKDTSLCGLGQTSPNPILSTLDNFYDEYLAHVKDHKCPAGQCKSLVKYAIDDDKCTGCTPVLQKLPGRSHHRERKGLALHRQQYLHQMRGMLRQMQIRCGKRLLKNFKYGNDQSDNR